MCIIVILTSGVTWGDLASSMEGICDGWTYSMSIKADSQVSGTWNGLLNMTVAVAIVTLYYLFSTVLQNSIRL